MRVRPVWDCMRRVLAKGHVHILIGVSLGFAGSYQDLGLH